VQHDFRRKHGCAFNQRTNRSRSPARRGAQLRISCPQVNHICRKHRKRDPYQIIMLIELHITHKVSDGAILAVLAPPQLLPLCKQQPSFSHDAYAEAQRARRHDACILLDVQAQNLTGVAYWMGVVGTAGAAGPGAPGTLSVLCPSRVVATCSKVQDACSSMTSLKTAPSEECDRSVRGVLCQQVGCEQTTHTLQARILVQAAVQGAEGAGIAAVQAVQGAEGAGMAAVLIPAVLQACLAQPLAAEQPCMCTRAATNHLGASRMPSPPPPISGANAMPTHPPAVRPTLHHTPAAPTHLTPVLRPAHSHTSPAPGPPRLHPSTRPVHPGPHQPPASPTSQPGSHLHQGS
jgi:hypothetical protein